MQTSTISLSPIDYSGTAFILIRANGRYFWAEIIIAGADIRIVLGFTKKPSG
jgi:hypothetical protein